MKARTILLILLLTCLLSSGSAMAQTNAPDQRQQYAVEGTASANGYRLETLDWQASGNSGANGYQLLSFRPNAGGCCCTYLPCTMKNK